ncbi:hypothetical protein Lal_00037362 [Lupinus albus]|nr:hypothetical protein Lal_00037362 [Lupinus albus]
MNTINPQSKELSGLICGKRNHSYSLHKSILDDKLWIHVSIISQSQGLQVLVEMHGKMYPSLIREFYSNFKCKNGVYQTMAKNIFIILDEDFLVDIGGLGRFDHP